MNVLILVTRSLLPFFGTLLSDLMNNGYKLGFVCLFVSFTSGRGFNLGRVKRGPQKEGDNIYLVYEDGEACPGGGNYTSRIQMNCGPTEVWFEC